MRGLHQNEEHFMSNIYSELATQNSSLKIYHS